MKEWLKYNGRWALALIVAGLGSCWTRQGWIRIGKAFALWFGILRHRGPTIPQNLYELRYHICERCPLFYAPLRTCGSPLKRDLRRLGCWCYLPEKAKLLSAKCWIDDELGELDDLGWKKAGG